MEATYDLFTIKTQCITFVNYAYLGIDKSSRKAFVVDPSWDVSQLVHKLNEHGATLEAVLLTHSHFDHTNMVNKLEMLYQPTVYLSKREAEYYRYRCNRLKTVEDMERIRIGDTLINCLVTPGHTQGSVCYWAGGNLFSGDTVFIEGCGLCDSEGGSAEDMYYSIHRLISLIPANVQVYPGHSFGEPPGREMSYLYKKNLYFQIDDINHFVKYRNRKNNTRIFDFK
ncbi:polyketide biosynthesis protein [Paenibacillus sp. FSL R7-0273]|uniref:MBL fold metallo-hydrolase n=1 Tax=Paenibacillus sp. FSL R7-0273 TaxID=1536772 RepID=UPI0004F633AB|nr:MBL fold metallo-hydrolase [Paenibacillus sp. FSL R7-0273]AIQ47421.1 polyketide biosynthesis protein [Paenibacillus sp. FSL R7-0273]OMF96021.1 MBL fold metallo-hydrolase [Paenibacillus sp. FSL R7-0273]